MSTLSPELEERLFQTIADIFGVDVVELNDESSPETIPAWDSLNHLNLVMALESEFDISLTPEESLELHSIKDIRQLLGPADPMRRRREVITFADCKDQDIPAVKRFIEKSYGRNYVLGVNDDYFQWQYGSTAISTGQDFHLRLAFVNGQIAGCLGYVPVELSIGGEIVRACWLANWMVDPTHRQLGLGPVLVREVSKDFEVTLALGANADAQNMLSRMGWTDFGMLRRYVAVLDEQGARCLTADRQLDWPVSAGELVDDLDVDVKRVATFDQDVTRLWDQLWTVNESAAGTRRTQGFLRWRYTDHSDFKYRHFEARVKGKLAGFAVYRIEHARDFPVCVGRMVEFVSRPEHRGALLRRLLDDAEAEGAVAVDYFAGSQQDWLLQCGFLSAGHPAADKIPILYQPVDRRRAGIRFLADLSKVPHADRITDWYVSKADGDQDRPN